MYNSEEESDDILLRPTNFSTKETMIKQALTTPKSTINTIQLANEEINEKRGYQDSKISPINEEYEFFDEDFQKTTKNLKEKYREFMKNKNSISEERKSVYEIENEYQDDFEALDNPSKANSLERIKDNYHYDEDYPDDQENFLGNELPEDGEDLPPDFPTIDANDEFENLEDKIESPKKTIKNSTLNAEHNQVNTLSFGTKEHLDEIKVPRAIKVDDYYQSQNDKPNRLKTANFLAPQIKEKSKTPKGRVDNQYTINNYNVYFNENKKNEAAEKKRKAELTPNKKNISVDYGRKNPVPPPKKAALTPNNRKEPTKLPEKEDLLNKSDLTSVREKPKRVTPNRYEDIKRVELPHIKNENQPSRPRNLSDESSRYRPGRILQKEKRKEQSREKSQDKNENSILIIQENKDKGELDLRPSPRLGENLSTDMNSATNISYVAPDRDKDSHNSQARLLMQSITTAPHKSISSSNKVKSIISEHYFLAERIDHLLTVDIKYKSDQELVVHNNVLRRYINETKEDLRRILGKAITSHRDSAARHVSPHIKISKLEEDISFNENLIMAYTKEIEGLAKTLRKATDLTYISELDSKIEAVQNKIKKVQKEKKEFDLIQKKELYLCFGNNFLDPLVFDHDKNKINKFNQKRETYDVVARDTKILQKRNKKANELIKEQTEHLSDMNERYNKLKDIAVHFGIIFDQKKKKELENLQKKSADLSRAITILEKSIIQKTKIYQYEINKFQSELVNEKKKIRKTHNHLNSLNKSSIILKKQIEEMEEIRDKYILLDKNNGNEQNIEDYRFRVTQNETSTMNLDTEKEDIDLDFGEKNLEAGSLNAKVASETTDPHLKAGEDIIDEEEIEMIKKVQEQEQEEEERKKTVENLLVDAPPQMVKSGNQKEVIMDIQQINKIHLDQKIEVLDMDNKFQNISRLSKLFEHDNKKKVDSVYENYSIVQEFKIIQEPTYTMEDRPEMQFSGMDNSIHTKLKDGISKKILSKNNSMNSSYAYTIPQKYTSKITNTHTSEENDKNDDRVSSPSRKIDMNNEEYIEKSINRKPKEQRQPTYKIRGNFEISESEERLEVLRSSKENYLNKIKGMESETASTQRLDIRGSITSNDMTVKPLNTQSPPTMEGSPTSHSTYKVLDGDKDLGKINLDSKPTPRHKEKKINLEERQIGVEKPRVSEREEFLSTRTKHEKEALSTLENPIVTETKSSISHNEKFKALLSSTPHEEKIESNDNEINPSNKEVLTLSDLQPINIQNNVASSNQKAHIQQEFTLTDSRIKMKNNSNLIENRVINPPLQEKKDPEKLFNFLDDDIDVEKINFEAKGKILFGQNQNENQKNGGILDNISVQKERELKQSNLNFTMEDQPSSINQPRGGMPRRMRIGDNEKKRQEMDLAKKVEKDGNDFFTDFGF